MAVTDFLQLRRSTGVSLTNSIVTLVSWDIEDVDVSGYWAAGAPTRIIPPAGKEGLQLFSFSWSTNGSNGGSGFGLAEVYNSGNVLQRGYYGPTGYEEDMGILTVVTKLAAGDYITFSVFQNSGAGRTLTGGRLEWVRLA